MPQLDLYLWNFSILFYFILFLLFYFFVLNIFLIKLIKSLYFRKFFSNKLEFENKYFSKIIDFVFISNLFNHNYFIFLNLQLKNISFYKLIFFNYLKFLFFINNIEYNNLLQTKNFFDFFVYFDFCFNKGLILNLLIDEKFF